MVGPSHAMPRQRVYFSPYLLLQTLGEGEFGKVKLGENPQKLIEMINRHSRLTRSIGQIGPIQSTTSLRLNLHQAQRNLSATTATAATSTEGVNETKNQKTSSYAEIKGNFCLYQSIDPESIQRMIEYLKRDAERLQNRLKDVQSSSNSIGSEGEIERLEILSEVNDVQVRKNHNSGSDQVDMSKPMYRFLEQQRWRKDGQLGRLTETVHPLRVFPDLFPSIDPTVDLRIKFEHTYSVGTYQTVNVGSFLPSSKSTKRPVMQAQVFYPEPRLYTIVMVDPDVPDPRNHSFTTFLHWVRTNVSMSATTNGQLDLIPTQPEAEELKYVGPHPAEGSATHRYTIMLIEQSGPIDLSVHSHHSLERKGFSLHRNRNIIIPDFGFANCFEDRTSDLMATSCGSPCYVAPDRLPFVSNPTLSISDPFDCLFREKDASNLFAQLISGVTYLHAKKIVHRDLKLENLLLDRNRNIIITDFGFANRFEDRTSDLMATSCGSPCYAAPELVVQDGRYVGSQWLAKYQHLFTRSLKELERLSEENEQAKQLMLQRQRQLMAANTANQSQTAAGPSRTHAHGSGISVKEGVYLFQEGLDPYDSGLFHQVEAPTSFFL
ncbi:hypothetical protein PSTT_03988 [Puccinia striiformis]|uniref:Protein kinase domain-containing protein n=1 Tax=Puccinia striiformis TaxID=27350 RepID=A0A2S4VU88_9BASI|nr:hypothetical protein PSTT_03988 [Puccinia striiformis]